LMCESITQAPELLQELFEAGTAALVEALPSVCLLYTSRAHET